MAVPGVDQKLLGELEAMGFPAARATRALHFSGGFISSKRIAKFRNACVVLLPIDWWAWLMSKILGCL